MAETFLRGRGPSSFVDVFTLGKRTCMATIPSDYNLEVLRGNISGHAMVNIRGHDDTVPNGGPFGLSEGFGGGGYSFDQSVIAVTPAAVGVASTDNTNDNAAGTGALTVRITGLDSSGVAQTVDETMNGTTAVTTAETWSAVYQVVVLTTGSNNANTGDIWVGTGTFTAGIPAVRMISMGIGFNISLAAYYVVPTGKTFFIRQLIGTVGSSNKDASILIATSLDGTQFIRQIEFGLEGGQFIFPVIALPGLPAGAHVSLLAKGGAANTEITAIIAGELVDD